MNLLHKLYMRGWKYLIVGVGTFLLDMCILFSLVYLTPMPYMLAVAIGFLIGVSVNFYICYHWVYAGTNRKFHHGYIYFVTLAFSGAFIISFGTTLLHESLDLTLLMSRVIIGGVIGTIGYFINTFFNFRLL